MTAHEILMLVGQFQSVRRRLCGDDPSAQLYAEIKAALEAKDAEIAELQRKIVTLSTQEKP